jgi:hypothetical protein
MKLTFNINELHSYRNTSDVFEKSVVETPISVTTEVRESPMSIDSSLINKTLTKNVPHRSRCDLFDVTDYQKDILKYLKNVEVNFQCDLTCSMKQNSNNFIFLTE